MAVGARPRRGRQPHHQPAAAAPPRDRRRARRRRASHRRALGPRLRHLPQGRAGGDRDPGGGAGPGRRPGDRHRARHPARGPAARLDGGGAPRRPGDHQRGGCGVLRRPAAGGAAVLRRRGQLPGRAVPAAPRHARGAVRDRRRRDRRADLRPAGRRRRRAGPAGPPAAGPPRPRAARPARAGLPVLEGALERSVALAAAMDSRGYGRRVPVTGTPPGRDADRDPRRARRWSASGCTARSTSARPGCSGLPVLLAGVAVSAVGLVAGGRRHAPHPLPPGPLGRAPSGWSRPPGSWPRSPSALADPLLRSTPRRSRSSPPRCRCWPPSACWSALCPAVVAPVVRASATADRTPGATRRRWPRDPLRGRHRHLRRGRPPRCSAHVDLHVPEGELCLVVGRTGSGKSTLLRAVNGLVPHFTGGHALRPGDRRRPRHPHPPAARARRRRRRGAAGPARRLRHRHGRGRARLRDGVARGRRRR